MPSARAAVAAPCPPSTANRDLAPRRPVRPALRPPRLAAAVATLGLLLAPVGVAEAAAPGEIPKPPGSNPGNRGWEKVTPADKGGLDVGGVSYRTRSQAADGGGALAFGAMGTFAGAPVGAFPTYYLTRRRSDGWSTSAISPSSTASAVAAANGGGGRTANVYSLDADLETAVVEANDPVTPGTLPNVFNLFDRDLGTGDLRLRTPAGPSFVDTLIGKAVFGRDVAPLFEASNPSAQNILFGSYWPYVAGASPDAYNLYESVDGEVRLLPLPGDVPIAAGKEAHAGSLESTHHAVSEDGRRIYFMVQDERDNGASAILYLREDGATVPVTEEPGAVFTAATPRGERALYQERLAGEIRRYDAETGTSTLVSTDEEPADGLGGLDVAVVAASDDLDYVYFTAGAMRVAGQEPLEGDSGLYLWHDGDLRFIARLRDDVDDPYTGIGDGPYGVYPITNSWINRTYVSWTPDGRSLVFDTTARMTEYDSEGKRQVYRYDADEDELSCLSCPDGRATSDAVLSGKPTGYMGTHGRPFSHRPRNHISRDGRRVFFRTGDALVPGDVNGRDDVYVSEDGELALVSDGKSAFDAWFVDASADGGDVFFATRAQLVASDTDDLVDIYDARVGGGFPEPERPRPACSEEGCQAPPSGAPDRRSRSSAGSSGQGDLAPGERARLTIAGMTAAQRSGLAAGKRVRLRLVVSRAGTVVVSVRGRIGKRVRVVAAGRARARKAGRVSVAVRLSGPARRQLRRNGRLALTVDARLGAVRSQPVGLRLSLTKPKGR